MRNPKPFYFRRQAFPATGFNGRLEACPPRRAGGLGLLPTRNGEPKTRPRTLPYFLRPLGAPLFGPPPAVSQCSAVLRVLGDLCVETTRVSRQHASTAGLRLARRGGLEVYPPVAGLRLQHWTLDLGPFPPPPFPPFAVYPPWRASSAISALKAVQFPCQRRGKKVINIKVCTWHGWKKCEKGHKNR